MKVLVLNAGSSSLKFKLISIVTSDEGKVLADGLVEKWGSPEAALKLSIEGKETEHRPVAAESAADAARHAIEACRPLGIDALGYRVVHGGPRYHEPARITEQVIEGICEVARLAPLHNGLALAGIEAGRKLLPQVPGVAVFDTAFHRTIPPVAAFYAIPPRLAEEHGLRRYGFHGISHRYVSTRLLQCMGRHATGTRLITAHLGNGASLCAIRDGQSIDTSMGLTPMEGLVMGTRSGDIDPGLVLHLISALGWQAERVDTFLNHECGLKGLSGRSPDVRDIEQAASQGDDLAKAALESFAYRARKYIGAYAAVLGGLDAIAFTAGIGEHSAQTRSRICRGLEFLGIGIDEGLNQNVQKAQCAIQSAESRVQVWVIPTDEEGQIAREIADLLGISPSPSIPGEGWGGGFAVGASEGNLLPNPPAEYRERG
jgi:acetate kinase